LLVLPLPLRMRWFNALPKFGYEHSAIVPAAPYDAACIAAIFEADELRASPHLTAVSVRKSVVACIASHELYLTFRAQLVDDLAARWLYSFGCSLTSSMAPVHCAARADSAAFHALYAALSTVGELQPDWRTVQRLVSAGERLDSFLDALDSMFAPPVGQNPDATKWRRLDLKVGEVTQVFMFRAKDVASLQREMTPAVFLTRLIEIASDVDAEIKSLETAAFLTWCRSLAPDTTPGLAATLLKVEHVSRIALRPAAAEHPEDDAGRHGHPGVSFPTKFEPKRGNNIAALYAHHNEPLPPVQVALAKDPEHPCPMCKLHGRRTVPYVLDDKGGRPKPPAGATFTHGAYRCQFFEADLRRLHAEHPELGLEVPALLEKIDAMVIYKAYCVEHGLTPQVGSSAGAA